MPAPDVLVLLRAALLLLEESERDARQAELRREAASACAAARPGAVELAQAHAAGVLAFHALFCPTMQM